MSGRNEPTDLTRGLDPLLFITIPEAPFPAVTIVLMCPSADEYESLMGEDLQSTRSYDGSWG